MDEARLAALDDALARDHRSLTEALAWARQHGLTGPEAQRFLTRQRRSLTRQREAETRQRAYDPQPRTQSLLWCCQRWHPIHQMPLRVLCCGKVYLAEVPRHA